MEDLISGCSINIPRERRRKDQLSLSGLVDANGQWGLLHGVSGLLAGDVRQLSAALPSAKMGCGSITTSFPMRQSCLPPNPPPGGIYGCVR